MRGANRYLTQRLGVFLQALLLLFPACSEPAPEPAAVSLLTLPRTESTGEAYARRVVLVDSSALCMLPPIRQASRRGVPRLRAPYEGAAMPKL